MNNPEKNKETIEILEKSDKVFQETDQKSKIDEVTKEIPLAFARKFAGISAVLIWIMSVIGLLTGMAEMRVLAPVLLLPLATLCFLNIPVFLHKKKKFDVVVAVVVGVILILLALSLFAVEPR